MFLTLKSQRFCIDDKPRSLIQIPYTHMYGDIILPGAISSRSFIVVRGWYEKNLGFLKYLLTYLSSNMHCDGHRATFPSRLKQNLVDNIIARFGPLILQVKIKIKIVQS